MTAISFGSQVIWRRPGMYPVRGIAENFINVYQDTGPVFAANVTVSQDAGLYRRGDLITVPVAELEVTS